LKIENVIVLKMPIGDANAAKLLYPAPKFLKIGNANLYFGFNPHFSPSFCCGGGFGHVYCVALPRAPRHTVKYACGALRRVPCIHARLHRLATKHGEKCGLDEGQSPYYHSFSTLKTALYTDY